MRPFRCSKMKKKNDGILPMEMAESRYLLFDYLGGSFLEKLLSQSILRNLLNEGSPRYLHSDISGQLYNFRQV